MQDGGWRRGGGGEVEGVSLSQCGRPKQMARERGLRLPQSPALLPTYPPLLFLFLTFLLFSNSPLSPIVLLLSHSISPADITAFYLAFPAGSRLTIKLWWRHSFISVMHHPKFQSRMPHATDQETDAPSLTIKHFSFLSMSNM